MNYNNCRPSRGVIFKRFINFVDNIINKRSMNIINHISSLNLAGNIIVKNTTTSKDTINCQSSLYGGQLTDKQLGLLQLLQNSLSNEWNAFRHNMTSISWLRSLKSIQTGIGNDGVADNNSNNNNNNDHTDNSAPSSVDSIASKAGKDTNDNDNESRRSRTNSCNNSTSGSRQNSTCAGGGHNNVIRVARVQTIMRKDDGKRLIHSKQCKSRCFFLKKLLKTPKVDYLCQIFFDVCVLFTSFL